MNGIEHYLAACTGVNESPDNYIYAAKCGIYMTAIIS